MARMQEDWELEEERANAQREKEQAKNRKRQERAAYINRAKKQHIPVRQALFYWREFASKRHSHDHYSGLNEMIF